MSRFNGLLDAIFLPPRNWVLNNKLTFIADITDLASVPRACWAFIAPFDVARAAVVHDILYEKINGAFKAGIIPTKKARELYRSIADKIFLQGMQYAEPSVPKWKIKSAYYAVRLFGRWAINSSAPRGAKPTK